MAPIKFEDNLKEKLEQRRLQPSIKAWVTLQNKLDSNQKKQNNKTFWWFGIAASFVGVLIVTSLFFNKKTDNTIEQHIVDAEAIKVPIKMDTDDSKKEVLIEEELKTEKPLTKPNKLVIKNKSILQQQLQDQQNKLIKENVNEAIAQTDTKEEEKVTNDKANVPKALSFEDIKLQEVVAQVQELKKNNQAVSDAEIDALLNQAQKEITLYNLYNESTKKVDAEALLQDVEADLEQTFRERAFKAIKSGFEYVKTEVAERNN